MILFQTRRIGTAKGKRCGRMKTRAIGNCMDRYSGWDRGTYHLRMLDECDVGLVCRLVAFSQSVAMFVKDVVASPVGCRIHAQQYRTR